VESKIISANARMAMLVRNNSGNAIRGLPLYVVTPNNIPVINKSRTSGILILDAIHEHITPTNKSTAIEVIIVNASFIFTSFFML